MTAQECLQHRWLLVTDVTQLDTADHGTTNEIPSATEADGDTKDPTNCRQQSELTVSNCESTSIIVDELKSDESLSQPQPPTPRRQLSSTVDSPSGLRRALLLTLDGDNDVIVDHEPTKRYRCDVTSCDVVAVTSSAASHVTCCDGSSVLPAPLNCVTRVSVA